MHQKKKRNGRGVETKPTRVHHDVFQEIGCRRLEAFGICMFGGLGEISKATVHCRDMVAPD
jgi:hypothetical protein